MQINRTGYLLLAFFGIGGLIFTFLDFFVFPFPILIGPIWLLVVLGLVIYAIRQARRGRHEQWLWRSGVRGRGTLVSARSGAEINEQPLMTLELDLEVPGQAAAAGEAPADHLRLRRPSDAAGPGAAGLRQPPGPRRHPRRLVSTASRPAPRISRP